MIFENIMDAINDILSEFIDKKELVKGLFSKIQSAIFLDKLQESKTAFVSKRAYEPSYSPASGILCFCLHLYPQQQSPEFRPPAVIAE
jgi:hypothetical protein